MIRKLLLTLFFLFVPVFAFAWGPLTHVYLGSEIFSFASLIPVGVYELIRKYRQDFIYGNIMADSVLARKYLPTERHSHSWQVGLELYDSAATDQEKAFCIGFLCHLAADTVAHGDYTSGHSNLGHALKELRADAEVSKSHWVEVMSIQPSVKRRNDAFLESRLERVMFSYKTNSLVFKGVVAAMGFNWKLKTFRPGLTELDELHAQSLERMLDILINGREGIVTSLDAIGDLNRGWIMERILCTPDNHLL